MTELSASRYSVEMNEVERGGFIVRLHAKESVLDAWPPCAAYIAASCRRGPCEFEPLQLRDDCAAGRRNLWTIRERGKGIVCAAVTTVLMMGGRKTLVWTALGGRRWDMWAEFEEVVAATAKQNGVEAIRGYCRVGWKKKLKHYREIGTIMEREL